jgi:VanZ family protein
MRRKRRAVAWPILLAGTITFCSGFSVPSVDTGGFPLDKVAHFCIYGALATALVRNHGLKHRLILGCGWAIVLTSAYGLGDEFRQSFTVVRQFEWADWMADTLGASVAVALYLRWAAYRRLMEMPLRRKKPRVETSPALPPTLAT